MINAIQDIVSYRELLFTLAWKNVAVRYKQAYLGIVLAVLKPALLMCIFTIVRSFVGIDSGKIPYPVLTFAALMPWSFFQDATSEGVDSVVVNASLVRKIYFPREILVLSGFLSKLFELAINFAVLAVLMVHYNMAPRVEALWWCPLLLIGSALNVYYRDVSRLLPVALNLFMYISPVIYPLGLVQRKLLVDGAAGDWSHLMYRIYTLNPLAGIIDTFQAVMLRKGVPNLDTLWPGFVLVIVLLPVSYRFFKRAEHHFADVI
jgi:lipopolysaccharide transport system permease protein